MVELTIMAQEVELVVATMEGMAVFVMGFGLTFAEETERLLVQA